MTASAGPERASARIADVEVLRGVAVLMVLVFHIRRNLVPVTQPFFLNALSRYFLFFPGVDLFFAISGFVIARSLLPALSASTTNTEFWTITANFWIRRIFRLWPAAWLWLAVTLALSVTFNRSGAFYTVEGNLWSTLAGMLNYANWSTAQAFMRGDGFGASAHYWTLSLEEQFYLALPLVVFAFRKWLPVALIVGVLAQSGHFRTILLTNFRSDALLLGVLLAIWSRRESYRRAEPTILSRSRLLRGLFVWGPIIAMSAIGALDPLSTIVGLRVGDWNLGLIAICATLVVFVASYDRNYVCPGGWLRRSLIWVGGRSYSLYLVHLACYYAATEIDFRLGAADPIFGSHSVTRLLAIGLTLTLVSAELLHRFVELPGRAYGIRLARRLAEKPAPSLLPLAGEGART